MFHDVEEAQAIRFPTWTLFRISPLISARACDFVSPKRAEPSSLLRFLPRERGVVRPILLISTPQHVFIQSAFHAISDLSSQQRDESWRFELPKCDVRELKLCRQDPDASAEPGEREREVRIGIPSSSNNRGERDWPSRKEIGPAIALLTRSPVNFVGNFVGNLVVGF